MSVTIIVKDKAKFHYRPTAGESRAMKNQLRGGRKRPGHVSIPDRALRELPPEARRNPEVLKKWAERAGWSKP